MELPTSKCNLLDILTGFETGVTEEMILALPFGLNPPTTSDLQERTIVAGKNDLRVSYPQGKRGSLAVLAIS
jgi:hypothetical protein